MRMGDPPGNKHKGILSIKSWRQLEHLLKRDRRHLRQLAASAGRRYASFDLQRVDKPHSKWRHIDNPTGELKLVQKSIQRNILRGLVLPATMIGGAPGGSPAKNAAHHSQAPIVVTLDLKNCFPSIEHARVYEIYREYLGCSAEIAALLTKLTTFQRHLPQGAPTSSMLANLVLLRLHADILEICHEFGCRSTIFVDDIAISGGRAEECIEPVVRLIQSYGYGVACRKKLIMPLNTRQVVTGIVVNTDLSLGSGARENLRTHIIALARREISCWEMSSLDGRIRHFAQFRPRGAAKLRGLADRILSQATSDEPRPDKNRRRTCKSLHRRSHRAS